MEKFASKTEHIKADSTIVVVLSHGDHGLIEGVDEQSVAVDEFLSYLNGKRCPALLNKPKVFIIQACRGSKCWEGLELCM